MFCPNCKTEYRAGFTQCSDCGSTLVEVSDADAARFDPSTDFVSDDARRDTPFRLWAGDSTRVLQELRAALEAAEIPFVDSPSPRLVYVSVRPSMEIWISSRDSDAAVKIRRSILAEEERSPGGIAPVALGDESDVSFNLWGYAEPSITDVVTGRLPGSQGDPDRLARDLAEPPDEAAPVVSYFSSDAADNIFGGEFFPEDAVVEVYSGDRETAENVRVCLRENGIPCAVDKPEEEPAASVNIRVLPEHEARAKEIVREVIEATPPE